MGVGIGEAAASPSAHSLIADFYPASRRSTAMAIYTMGASFGITLGFAVGGWLSDTLGWRAAFVIVGPPGLLLALRVRLSVREPPRGMLETQLGDDRAYRLSEVLRFLWGSRAFRHLSLAAAMYGMGTYGAYAWTPTFMTRVHGMSRSGVGAQLGPAIGLAGMTGSLLWAVLADRLARADVRWQMWAPALGSLLSTPFLVLFLFWRRPGLALLFSSETRECDTRC